MPRAKPLLESDRGEKATWFLNRIDVAHKYKFDRTRTEALLKGADLSLARADNFEKWLLYILCEYEHMKGQKDSMSPCLGISITDKQYLATLKKAFRQTHDWTNAKTDEAPFKAIPAGMLSNVVSRIHGAQNLKKAMITEIRREISEVENRINSREKKCVDDIEPFAVACVARLVFVFFLVHSAQNAKVSKSRRYRFASESLKDLGINHPRFEDSNGHTYRFFGSAECEAMASLKRKKPTIFDHPSGVMPPFARRVIAEQ